MNSRGRWKRTAKEITDIFLARYVNLHPDLTNKIITTFSEANVLSMKCGTSIISKILGRLSAVPQTSEKYWLQRGWSSKESIMRARERKLLSVRKTENIKSPFSVDHWFEKINPNTGKIFTLEEAEYKRNSLRPIRKEYWMELGHNIKDAIELAKDAKNKNNRNGKTKDCVYTLRTIGYYQVRGHSLEKAQKLLSEAQSTFSLEKMIKKHGESVGRQTWQKRQDKWQTTLNSKPFEEQEVINQKKIWKSGSMSKISLRLFESIHIPNARWGIKREDNNGELMVKLEDNKRAMIDFSFGNKLIEFYGDYWHANPKKYKANDKIITRKAGEVLAESIWKLDLEREIILKNLGYKLLIIWEYDFNKDPEKTINLCKNFLTL